MLDNRKSPEVADYVRGVVDVLGDRPDCGNIRITVTMYPENAKAASSCQTDGEAAGDAGHFLFSLNQVVKLKESAEIGTVIGRAEHINAVNSYNVRYRAADGRQVEGWWCEDALDAF